MLSPRNIRLVLAASVMVAVVGIVTAVSLKGSKSVPPEPVSRHLPQNIDVALHKARFSEMRAGTVVWELVADQAQYDRDGDLAYLSGIRMEFARSATAGTIVVTGERGEYSVRKRNVKLSGKVRVTAENGVSFETEKLDYLAERSRFVCPQQVRFHHHRLDLVASRMELDVKTQAARFHDAVEATVAGPQVH